MVCPQANSDLIIDVQLVCVASLHDQAQQVGFAVDLHTLQLSGLVPCAFIAVEAQVSQTLHDALLWICPPGRQAANMDLYLSRDL